MIARNRISPRTQSRFNQEGSHCFPAPVPAMSRATSLCADFRFLSRLAIGFVPRNGSLKIKRESVGLGFRFDVPIGGEQADFADRGQQSCPLARIGASDPDPSPGQAVKIVFRFDRMLDLYVIDHHVVEAGLPGSRRFWMIADAHPAFAVDGDGADKFAG